MTVKMRKAKSIEELFEEAKDFDLVIVPDENLAEALNARYGRPRVEPWCMTPRSIARKLAAEVLGEPLIDDMQLVRNISEDTGIGDMRFILGEVQHIRDMFRYTTDPSAYTYSRRSRMVLESFLHQYVIEKVMHDFRSTDQQFYMRHMGTGRGIAVVGIDLIDALSRFMLPYDPDRDLEDLYTEIDPFTTEEYVIDRIFEVGNDRLVAENAAELVSEDCPDQFAVVVRKGSDMETAIRSSLCRREIPVQETVGVRDLGDIRDFISFADLALEADTLRVRHVRGLFARYGGFFSQGIDEHLLMKASPTDVKGRSIVLRDAMSSIRGITFGELADTLSKDPDGPVQSILTETGMGGRTVSESNVGMLRYLVENVDLDAGDDDDEEGGVIISDSASAVWIDRPVVIFLGMDTDWDPDLAGKRYIEPLDEAQRDAYRCQVLLQQGDARFYLVDASRDGERAVPSSVFGTMLRMDHSQEPPPKNFDGLLPSSDKTNRTRWTDGRTGCKALGIEHIAPEGKRLDDKFSKTTFNAFMECPQKFVLSKAIGTDESSDMELGDLVHWFAELCAVHPEIVDEKGVEHFVRRLSETYSGISSPSLSRIDTDRIRMELMGIRDFIRHIGVRIEEKDKPIREGYNPLFDEEGLTMSSTHCESEPGISLDLVHGRFDLYWNGIVCDYKSGKKRIPAKVISAMLPGSGSRYLDFQPMIYLLLSSAQPDSAKEFVLYFPFGDGKEISIGEEVERNTVTVRIIDGTADGHVIDAVQATASDPCNLGRPVSDEELARIVSAIAEHFGSEDPLVWTVNNKDLRSMLCSDARLPPSDGWNKVIDTFIKLSVQNAKNGGLFSAGSEVLIPEDVLGRFEELLSRMHEILISGSTEGYDIGTKTVKCSDCRYRTLCTLAVDDSTEDIDGGDDDE